MVYIVNFLQKDFKNAIELLLTEDCNSFNYYYLVNWGDTKFCKKIISANKVKKIEILNISHKINRKKAFLQLELTYLGWDWSEKKAIINRIMVKEKFTWKIVR